MSFTKYLLAGVSLLILSCTLMDNDFIIVKESHAENINGNKKLFVIIKTLRKHDKLPVSIFTKNKNNSGNYETMDSVFYNGSKLSYIKSFKKVGRHWVLLKIKG